MEVNIKENNLKNSSRFLKIATEAAKKAGSILENYFQTQLEKEFKEDKSIVTRADKESEELIMKMILEEFPDHSIFTEESGMIENKGEYMWHIDPLDGTTNFTNGIPIFSISLALEYKREIILGVIYDPISHNMFHTEKGKGAYMNDKKISVSKSDQAHCAVTISANKEKENKLLARKLIYNLPEKIASVRILGSVATELAYLSRGGIGANIEFGLHTYDFAAGTLLVKEAGGTITKLNGSEWKFPENNFIASNGVFHDLLVEEVKIQKANILASSV